MLLNIVTVYFNRFLVELFPLICSRALYCTRYNFESSTQYKHHKNWFTVLEYYDAQYFSFYIFFPDDEEEEENRYYVLRSERNYQISLVICARNCITSFSLHLFYAILQKEVVKAIVILKIEQ